tara:strand:+ start:93 stop:329 length:237 start_codon:yes stop_codon:yes gene_type:complete
MKSIKYLNPLALLFALALLNSCGGGGGGGLNSVSVREASATEADTTAAADDTEESVSAAETIVVNVFGNCEFGVCRFE